MHTPYSIVSPTGETRAVIVPSLGFTCIEFTTFIKGRTVSLLDTEADFLSGGCRPGRSGIPLLFPFPNRIAGGRFTHRGRTYEVTPPEWFPQTIHGFCLDRPWRVLESTSSRITGEFLLSRDAPQRRSQWPADARMVVTYSVDASRLRADIRIENPDTVSLPWGFGTHPYFRLPLGPESAPENCLIQAAAGEQWELNQCYPTGTRLPVPVQKDLREAWRYGTGPLDDVYTGLSPVAGVIEQMIRDPRSGVKMSQRSCDAFRELVVFTPKDRPVICLEPYTCVTDAANLSARGIDSGWQDLAPGTQTELWFELEVAEMG